MRTLITFATLLFAAPALFASASTPMPQSSPMPMSMPSARERSLTSYNEGLRYRDRAWAAEKELVTARDEGKRAKLEQAVRKSYEADIRSQRAAIRDNPDFFQALTELAYALRKTGDYANALAMYDKALAVQPNYAEAIEYRGEAYLALNRVDDARGAYLILYNGGDKVRAQLLADAMQKWVAARRSDPAGVAPNAVDQMAKWLSQRSEIATQSGAVASSGSWR